MSRQLFARHIAHADRLMWLPIGLIGALCLIVGSFTQTLWIAIAYALATLPLAAWLQWKWPGLIFNGFIKAAVMMGWAAVLIEQSGGLIEAHFSIFILLAALILYSDWRVIAFGGLVVALHHAAFSWLQHLGYVHLYSGMVGSGHDHDHSGAELVACLLMHGGAVVVQVGILGYLAKVLSRTVAEGLHVTRFAHKAGKGHLDTTFTPQQQRLPAVAAVLTMRDQVAGSLHKTQAAAQAASQLSEQLFCAQDTLSEQIARNVSQTEKISTNATQLAGLTRDTAMESQHVRRLAQDAQAAMEDNDRQVNALQDMMHQLAQQADSISSMLAEIDHITFQTNLLALNASVEAARAGEQGRGFAVVASEVRKLAGNTQQTAERIRGNVEDITRQTASGVTQSQAASATTHRLEASFAEVARRLGSIDGALQQQHQGIDALEHSVTEIHDALERSNRSVSDAHEMAEKLSNTADTLLEAVSGFHLPPLRVAGSVASLSVTPRTALAEKDFIADKQ
ncbi:chemotaxis protein [Vreelandella venusta]|nr:chemotaxis protein [Halomonas hydrothermalis]